MKTLHIHLLAFVAAVSLAACSTAVVSSPSLDDEDGTTPASTTRGETTSISGNASNGNSNGSTSNGTTTAPEPWVPPPFAPAPATLHRLTEAEYKASVRDLFGIEPPVEFEAETSLHGFVSVAASELTLAPSTVDLLEESAWFVARAMVADSQARLTFVGCDVVQAGESCLRAWLVPFGRRVWRRPLTGAEVDLLAQVADTVGSDLRDPWQGVAAAVAVMLQSPHFVFRVERGEPDPGGERRYTNYEMAGRLSFLIWGTTPDDALLAAAERGELTTDEGLRVQAERLLDDPRAADRLSAFFLEFIGLDRLDLVTKDAEMFPEMSNALRDSMRREIELLFLHVAFSNEGGDTRELLTTDTTFVDGPLALLYGLDPVMGGGVEQRALPPAQNRGGLLGRAALLTLFSHASVNSPTLRGKFVRSKLLCEDVPPPPEGVVTELAEPEGGPQTLRERLDLHRSDPACAGCHSLMDPLGYPMEHFDPIGRHRDLDNGLPIDATGDVDGVFVDGTAELGHAVADSPKFADCLTRRFYRHATGHLEALTEERAIRDLTGGFVEGGYRFRSLVLGLVLSDGFRLAADPEGEPCETLGDRRDCSTACGAGFEVCADTGWGRCSALEAAAEVCDGVDNNCDGSIDEGLTRSCEGTCGAGVERCLGGAWGACEAPAPPPEVCDGLDNDCDGLIDEDLSVDVREVTFSALAASHEGCEGARQRRGPECNAAINRLCAGSSCARTGFGPIGTVGETARITCLAPEQVEIRETQYTALAAQHPVCDGGQERFGPNCNAAIHRWCADQGLVSGFGPLENGPNVAHVACVPNGAVIVTSYTALSNHRGNCHAGGERVGPICDEAIHQYCQSQGYTSGFGPVENSGDVAVVTCL